MQSFGKGRVFTKFEWIKMLVSELMFYTPHLFLQGVVKPDIVFFGENLPAKFFSFTIDMPQADLLIVMGTSLEVYIS